MKDIKSYIIGFLTCACLFLIMGQTKSDCQKGRYQGFGDGNTNWMIDTSSGVLYKWRYLKEKNGGSFWEQMLEPNRIGK